MNHPHKSQSAAMDRAGELPDCEQLRECVNSGQVSAAQVVAHAENGELSMSMFANRADYDKIVARQQAEDNIEYFVDQLKSHVKEFWYPLHKAVPLIRGVLQLYARDFAASSTALAAERAEVARLREALVQGEALINGDLTGLEWKVECRKFLVVARAALGLYQGEKHE